MSAESPYFWPKGPQIDSNRRYLEADESFVNSISRGQLSRFPPRGTVHPAFLSHGGFKGPPGALIIIKIELNGSFLYSGRFQSSTTPSRQLTGSRNGKKRARNELKRVNDDDPDSLILMILGTPLDSFFLSMVCLGGLICQVYHIHADSDA